MKKLTIIYSCLSFLFSISLMSYCNNSDKPNIMVIITDDQGYDYVNEMITPKAITPNSPFKTTRQLVDGVVEARHEWDPVYKRIKTETSKWNGDYYNFRGLN